MKKLIFIAFLFFAGQAYCQECKYLLDAEGQRHKIIYFKNTGDYYFCGDPATPRKKIAPGETFIDQDCDCPGKKTIHINPINPTALNRYRDSVSGIIGDAAINIRYNSQTVKGRKISAGFLPYDKIWSAGSTKFTAGRDIIVENKKLPAGTYSLFMIPKEGEWIVIFNRVSRQWGTLDYDESKDQLRIMVKPEKAAFHEKLIYKVNKNGVSLFWDNFEIPISVK